MKTETLNFLISAKKIDGERLVCDVMVAHSLSNKLEYFKKAKQRCVVEIYLMQHELQSARICSFLSRFAC